MQAVDIDRYRFDFDLTLAILIANPDGKIYHRIGGRTHQDPLAWMSMPHVIRVLRDALDTHTAYQRSLAAASAAKAAPVGGERTIYDIPTFRKKIARQGKKPACIHCHTIHDAEVRDAQARGVFRKRDIWVWPAPARIGLAMASGDQSLIVSVAKNSIAARAGLRASDRLLSLGEQRILTVHDIQWVLHNQPFEGGVLALRYRRGDTPHQAKLRLTAGFKATDAITYSWRSYKWQLRPAPGFGGPLLDAAARRSLGLAGKPWAIRVQYIVDWGDRPQQGRHNRQRGLRKGDVVYGYAGKGDFVSVAHFHSWVRLTRKRGEEVEIELLRKGEHRKIRVLLK